jgi:hypothetical protein
LPSPASSSKSDERGENGASLTTKELKVVRKMKEDRRGWITIVSNNRTLSYEIDEKGEKGVDCHPSRKV